MTVRTVISFAGSSWGSGCGALSGGSATLTGKSNASLSINIDRNNWRCAPSRAFREGARRTADTVRLPFTRSTARPLCKSSFLRRLKLPLENFPVASIQRTGFDEGRAGKPRKAHFSKSARSGAPY